MKENMKKTVAALSAAAVMLAASASIYACPNGSLADRFGGAKDASVPAAEQYEAQESVSGGSAESAAPESSGSAPQEFFRNGPAGMKGGFAGTGQGAGSYAESASEIVLSELAENSAEALTADYANAETIVMSDENSSVKISSAGTYIVTGSCADGSITVKKGTTGVVLVLRDLELTSTESAALSLNKGSEVKIVVEGTVSLTDAEDIANEESDDFDGAALKAKAGSSVVLTGSGTLNVNGSCKHGIKVSSLDEDDIADGYGEASFIVDGDLIINISAAEDGMNSGTDLTIKSGTVNVSAGDDGIKADYILTIGVEGAEGPEINVKKSAEGLEGAVVNIISGDITVNASDDGINAANSDLTDYSFSINIMGGSVTVSSGADGLDSNGDINITGGLTTIAKSAMNGGEGGMDYQGSCYVADGCLVNPYGITMDSGMGGFGGMNGMSGNGWMKGGESPDEATSVAPQDGTVPGFPENGTAPRVPQDGTAPEFPEDGTAPRVPQDGGMPMKGMRPQRGQGMPGGAAPLDGQTTQSLPGMTGGQSI